LVNGRLAAFFRRRSSAIRVFLPDADPERAAFARALAKKSAEVASRRQSRGSGLLIDAINGAPAREHFLAPFLQEAGFADTALGFQMRRITSITAEENHEAESPDSEDDAESGISETA
jgi:hypothetical protein